MTEPVPRTGPPPRAFLDGPAAGQHPVFPDEDGNFPAYVVMTDPYAQSPWTVDALQPTDPYPEWHVYARVRDPGGYIHHQSREAGKARITCPRCGQTSTEAHDVAAGYCASCHQWTRIPLLAVLYSGTVELPPGWDGRWVHRATVPQLAPTIAPNREWILAPSGLYEQNAAGGYAEMFLTRNPTSSRPDTL